MAQTNVGSFTKVTGNSMLRNYEKFGNAPFDGLPGWFAPILVTKGDYFLILCKKLFQNFNECNYDQLKTFLRSPVNRS